VIFIDWVPAEGVFGGGGGVVEGELLLEAEGELLLEAGELLAEAMSYRSSRE